jgi:hypothetical protein
MEARGVQFGRPPKLNSYQRQEALQRLAAGETQADIALTFGVDATTIRRLQRIAAALSAWPARPRDEAARRLIELLRTGAALGGSHVPTFVPTLPVFGALGATCNFCQKLTNNGHFLHFSTTVEIRKSNL